MFDIENKIKNKQLKVHGIEVYQNKNILYEHYFDENIRWPIYSVTKSILSAAVGHAVEHQKFDMTLPIYEYLEKSYLHLMAEEKRERFKKITVERLLKMAVPGFPFRPQGEDWLKFALESNEFDTEDLFSYSNISAYLVGLACENAVNIPLDDYINQNIFEPLSIERAEFLKDPQNHFYGATGVFLKIRELRKLGELYLSNGVYQNQRILSESWVKKSTSPLMRAGKNESYGYFIWVSEDHFSFSGKWGQKCLIYPPKNLIITYLSDLPEDSSKMLEIAQNIAEEVI